MMDENCNSSPISNWAISSKECIAWEFRIFGFIRQASLLEACHLNFMHLKKVVQLSERIVDPVTIKLQESMIRCWAPWTSWRITGLTSRRGWLTGMIWLIMGNWLFRN
jgi:hypothetical protein